MGAKKLYTDEEREKKRKENYLLRQKPKEEADYKRLEHVRINDSGKIPKKKRKEFQNEIKEINRKRFDEILNSEEIWGEINKSSDIWMVKKERQERKKRSGAGKWIKEKDIGSSD